ncbi:MAG: acyl-CoA desaturase [Symploca sp. SIO1B1]|nr:acyl-CoA desaturase [Symploca sp. SIO1B1]
MMQTKSLLGSTKRRKITIENDYLKKIQQRFAFATILIPSICSVFAIGLLSRSPISAVEIGLLVSMYSLTMVGLIVGFHRYFSHNAFRTHITIRITLAVLGCMAAQGPVIQWVSNHRRHHQLSDKPGDTHSPHIYEGKKFAQIRGFWYAHIGWMLKGEIINSALFAKDLLQDRTITKINQLYSTWVILGLAIPTVLGGIITASWIGAWQGFLWGGLVRIFLAHHAIWCVNSINHLYGSRPFSTGDRSTNNIWFAIPTFGGAWHHNHHAFPNSAKCGLQWWQIDLGYSVLRTLEMLGLVWDIKTPTPEMIKAKKAT